MIKSTSLQFFVIIFSSLLASMLSFGQPEKAEAGIRDIIQQHEVVGLSVAVVKNNKIIYTQSFGLKDQQHLSCNWPKQKNYL
jgi:CubicO group peptidase (beta-lactamase class C family)